MYVCSRGVASFTGQLEAQAPFPERLRTSGLSCWAERRPLVRWSSGAAQTASLCLPGLPSGPVGFEPGSSAWFPCSQSYWVLFCGSCTLLCSSYSQGFPGDFPSFSVFPCIPFLHNFCCAVQTVRDNSGRS